MRLFLGLIGYLIGTAALLAGAAVSVFVLAAPAVTTVLAQPETRTVAPRIQMWLDRNAEATVYAERTKAAALAEEEKWKAVQARIRIPNAADHAAFAKARDDDRRALSREISAQSKANARREVMPVEQTAPQPMRPARGYYPDLHANIY